MFKSRILIVEDDKALRFLLLHTLTDRYLVHLANDLAEAYQVLDKHKMDLVIIDRILPDGDGLELISFLKENSFTTHILVLSHKNMLADRITGLENGADDYLGKPFGTMELLLRVKRLLKTDKIDNDEVIATKKLKLNLQSGLISGEHISTRLRKREMQILAFLMRRRNQVIDRNHIIAGVWGAVAGQPTIATLDVYIRRIRLRLGVYATYLKTHRSYGYVYDESAN